MISPPLVALVLLVVAGVVPPAADAQSTGSHPNPQFIVASPRTIEISFAAPPRPDGLQRAERPLGVIGSLDGSAAQVFGRITSTAFINDSTIAILDATVSQVRLFTSSGRHLQTLGRAGSGPGEFRNPVTIAVSPAGEVLVADNRRTVQFFGRGTRTYEYRRIWNLPVGVRSMCYLGRTLFINGVAFEDGTLIRALDDSGKVVAAFGQIYQSPNTLLNYDVAQGRILCDSTRNLIYYMPGSLLGEVRAFRPDGELVWRVRVSDFLTNRVTDLDGGSMVERSPTGAHAAGNLVMIGRDRLIAQWTFMTPEQMKAKEAATQVHSISIDLASGAPTSLGTRLPLIGGVRGNLALEVTEDPIPQVQMRRYLAATRR